MQFSKEIIDWFLQNKRDLPWRDTKNPYPIWLSETILQQTRVEQGLPYYHKFITNYPTVEDLAEATEEDVLLLWQGLGYYSRARNLHFTAKHIAFDLKGKFPTDYKTLLTLKGVGDYTASAIASFAYQLPHAVVDGNVYRVLSRYFGINTPIDSTEGKKQFKQLAEELLSKKHPDTHNQSIMEFGALQCVPKNPKCENCPLVTSCYAYKDKAIDQLPVKSKKVKQRNRYFYYLYIKKDDKTYIQQRTKKDIWQNLFEFPLIETPTPVSFSELKKTDDWKNFFEENNIQSAKIIKQDIKHILSHQKIFTTFVQVEITSFSDTNLIPIIVANFENYAFPTLIKNEIVNNLFE